MKKNGIKHAEVERLAALMRGGCTWEEAAASLRVADHVLERFRSEIECLASKPGPVARPRRALTHEEETRSDEALCGPMNRRRYIRAR